METVNGMLTEQETALAEYCISYALSHGAQSVRVTLNKSLMDLFGTLNGEIDKVSHCLDRSMTFNFYVDGRYGTFSSNRLEKAGLEDFIVKAIATVRMLAQDEFRKLPDASRTEKAATTGLELGLFDSAYASMTAEQRLAKALAASRYAERARLEHGFSVISEEAEYSDSIFDTIVMDSNGVYCRHTETSFEYGVEVTVQAEDGERFSGYWWDAAPFLADLHEELCCETAVRRAAAQIGTVDIDGGKMTMVVQSECASKLVTPLLNALGAFAVQQNNSFLKDALGKKVFSEGLTIMDSCRTPGDTGSRLFDSEGVATKVVPIVDKGVVSEFFVNTYMAGKLGIDPTIEDATRPEILPYVDPSLAGASASEGLSSDGILALCGSGILVTGFNGGNSNSATGDFSYGVEGFAFKDGKIQHPVRGLVVTGNFVTLWNNLLAAGSDARRCMSRLIPTLAFKDVDFSA